MSSYIEDRDSYYDLTDADAVGDWPDCGSFRYVQIQCEQCGHRQRATEHGPVAFIDVAGDESRFYWKGTRVSVRRWQALTDMRQPVGRWMCPTCGWAVYIAAGIEGDIDE